MAGDARLPRLLIARWCAALAAASTLVAGCTPTPPASDERTAAAASGSTAAPARPAQRQAYDIDLTDRTDQEAEAALSRAAWSRTRTTDGAVIEAHDPGRLDAPIHPGSLFKVIAARAALDHGVGSQLRVACPRRVEIAGRRLDCVHPDLGRPLGLDDAVAHSCNHYFVRLASMLERRHVESAARALLGQPLDTGEAPLPLVVLGLEGPRLALRTWARALIAAAAAPERGPGARALLVRGLRAAVIDGTAAALDDPATLTLAKTGTSITLAGTAEGLVAAWRPDVQELVLVRAAGASGRDAARLARAVWARAARAAEPIVRVGITAPDGAPLPRVSPMSLESYVAGVVAGEAEAGAPPASLAALAIAARSYARAPDGRHAADGYDVCDITHCQRLLRATRWSRLAAASTSGIVLARGRRPVAVPYSAACSGSLVASSDVWGGRAAADVTLVGVDPGGHPVPTWRSDVSVDDLARVLAAAGHRGDVLRDVRIVGRTRSGRPTRVALDGLTPGDIDATTFRHVVGRGLGWDVLKSHDWRVSRRGRGFRFDGRGKGHGAGLCVLGADALGRAGWDAARILKAYVPGARLLSTQDRIVVRAPGRWTGELGAFDDTVRSLMAETRLHLCVGAPRKVDVRVHPTIEAYQRETGRAWWTAASTRKGADGAWRVDLAPPPGRASVAAVTGTLRHELVHVLTADALAPGPAWAAEGLATLVEPPDPASARVIAGSGSPCPDDESVTRPGDAVRLRQAYAAAAACVAAALPDGAASWRSLVGR